MGLTSGFIRILLAAELCIAAPVFAETYYEVLGLSPSATQDEIKTAYRKKANAFHPDHFTQSSAETQSEAEIKFKEAFKAYKALSDAETRRSYDASLAQGTTFEDRRPRDQTHSSSPFDFPEARSASLDLVFDDLESANNERVLRGLDWIIAKREEIRKNDRTEGRVFSLAFLFHRQQAHLFRWGSK